VTVSVCIVQALQTAALSVLSVCRQSLSANEISLVSLANVQLRGLMRFLKSIDRSPILTLVTSSLHVWRYKQFIGYKESIPYMTQQPGIK